MRCCQDKGDYREGSLDLAVVHGCRRAYSYTSHRYIWLLRGEYPVYKALPTNNVKRYFTPDQPLHTLAVRLGPIRDGGSCQEAFERQYWGLGLKFCGSAGGA